MTSAGGAEHPAHSAHPAASFGLTVRWHLDGAPAGAEAAFWEYVRERSHTRFSGFPGLQEKFWSVKPGEYVEGVYLWATPTDRAAWVESLRTTPSPVDQIVGHGPDLISEYDVVAVAEGGAGMPSPTVPAESVGH